jgi:RHH-type proline utilization regulon transcriptional repressor/proline dehydrogenase/delta 1-pyrroline-5-carboxylate dehydrogenase
MNEPAPFAAFAPSFRARSLLREAITAAYRRPEPEYLVDLLDAATLPMHVRRAAQQTARQLVTALRAKPIRSAVQSLMVEFSLSSHEGVALMCLAEALLRIPDRATRNALIRDKLASGDWTSHTGGGRPILVNAACWSLGVASKVLGNSDEPGFAAVLTRLGEPAIGRAVDLAMRMLGDQFVAAETIEDALGRSREQEAQGFSFSYDMLGEAAITAADAERYYRDYEKAIHAIGQASAGRGIYRGPGVSIKLSALHPRYSRAQAQRVMSELQPKVKALAALAKSYDIGFNIDAEEADRLELSLDLLESLALDCDLAGWNGLGFAVQCYSKRCLSVIEWTIDLARRARRRMMVRLVKGAYWDAEIKRAQVDGLADFPVHTRKVYTDVAYIACARQLLAAPDAIFPQFATHNAQTLATLYQMAGPDFHVGKYEFQCLHGMGESLFEEVVGEAKLGRPCRIYAPVGTHATLLAYLVRRLLENGANASFVNRIADATISIDELLEDPVEQVHAMVEPGRKHDQIRLPAELFPDRRNSAGLDLSDEGVLAALTEGLQQSAEIAWSAGDVGAMRPLLNPADHRDVVGTVHEMSAGQARAAMAKAASAGWSSTPVAERAAILERAADAMQARMPVLLGLLVREAGKSVPNAIAEVREAVDFLRYYAERARSSLGPGQVPLGPVVCISPWNFPLAIFTGQVAAALVAGNPVVAKPAEETPLIAAESVRLLHEAGATKDALQLVCGGAEIGATLVGCEQTAGVMFTGSTEVARLIHRQLSARLSPSGTTIPLIAETGGQNAMIVDSSALAEQVVTDVIASAFDSAGQRCSALRILCLQEEIADRTLTMLKGALSELRVGPTDRLAVDVGPVITAEAKANIERHIQAMRAKGCRVYQQHMPSETALGSFVPPTVIELGSISDLEREVFGPVLHVIRYQRERLDDVITKINATGYGLTFGLHTRLDRTIARVAKRVRAGNIYINRNVIGAIVGVQPFGGRGLSGTGPKAGGPLYLGRLVQKPLLQRVDKIADPGPAVLEFVNWLDGRGEQELARLVRLIGASSPLGLEVELPGPVGERNVYALKPRGAIQLRPVTARGLLHQLAVALVTGNSVSIEADSSLQLLAGELPACVRRCIRSKPEPISAVLVEGSPADTLAALRSVAEQPGEIVLVHAAPSDQMLSPTAYCCAWLVEEVVTSINTTAAGGNASLMALS